MNKRSIQFDPENSIYRSRIFICSSHLEFIGSRKFINLDRFREKDSVRRVSRHFAFAQFSFLSWLWIIDARVDTARLTVGSTLILSLSLSANSTVLSPLTYRPFPFLSTYLETCTYPQKRFSLSSKYNKVARVRRFRRPFSLLYKPCSNKRTPTSKENGGFRSCVGRDDSFFNFIGSCHVIKWTGPVR